MVNLASYNPDLVSNPDNNIFGLPTDEPNARLIILPVPWEVTVSYGAGTARAPESVLRASYQVDVFDADMPEAWHQGYFQRAVDKKLLLKSDYLRKEAELYIDYIAHGEIVSSNAFMSKSLKEVNEGCGQMNEWVYEQTGKLIDEGKLVGLLGGDHSIPYGFLKALGERKGSFGILQIDAHCDLRENYEGFLFSHAGIMFNVLRDIPQVERLVQIGVRDYGPCEWKYIQDSNFKVITYFDRSIKQRLFEGSTWKQLAEEIVNQLPQQVYISFDIDGLDQKLCPDTGTPVPGGFELEQLFYLFKKIIESGRKLVGFDLCEIGVGENDWNANVGARALFKLCNLLTTSNQPA
jgi:agmatinase